MSHIRVAGKIVKNVVTFGQQIWNLYHLNNLHNNQVSFTLQLS